MEILQHDFKLLPSVAWIKHSQAVLEIYNVLPPGFKSTLMRIADRLQVLDRLLEHVASAFQSLDLIFEVFD